DIGAELVERSLANSLSRLTAEQLFERLSAFSLRDFAARQIAETTFGRELFRYFAARMAFGVGLMGGGDFLAQLAEVLGGHRADFDWGEVGLRSFEGAAFGAGMWGGFLGHMLGGGLMGGLVAGGESHGDLDAMLHGAVQGAEAGAVFGTMNRLQTMRVNVEMPIGTEVHALPSERGGLIVRAFDRNTGTGVVLTDIKGIAFETRDEMGNVETAGYSDRFVNDPSIGKLANLLRAVDVDVDRGTTVHDDGFVRESRPYEPAMAQLPAIDAPPRQVVPVAGGGDGGGGPRTPTTLRPTEPTRSPETPGGEHGDQPGAQHDTGGPDLFTGAKIRPMDDFTAFDWADQAYDRFRGNDTDVGAIAANLSDVPRPSETVGFTPAEVSQIKNHLMVETHLLDDYQGGVIEQRFDSSPDIAEAWIRLREGHWLPEDLVLLEHELTESNYLQAHPGATYREAHTFANERYNWADIAPERTGEDLDTSWGQERSGGDTSGLQEGPGRQTGGRVPLRVPGDDPQPGHHEVGPGGDAVGRQPGPRLLGRTGEDSAFVPQPGELAGTGFVRGLTASGRIPYELVPVEPTEVGPVLEVPHSVADTIEAHLADLLRGQPPGDPDLPYLAVWDPQSQTMLVRYPDGLGVRVVLQVNSALPAGHPTVLRPALVPAEHGWVQATPAGVVLPAHAPVDPAARETAVRDQLTNAWRTLYRELTPL
ncbi:MAG TPA: hypothetical protein VFE14_07495, partial [Micromonosporaceae bacterium]|nr:hypothetical protein [Micromonosporaceae bacterium]